MKFARDRISTSAKFDDSEGSNHGPQLARKEINIHLTSQLSGSYLFIPSAWRSSKKSGVFVTACNILASFDLCAAVRDTRRFHFVCELLEIISEDHFGSLSGSAMQHLFAILEQTVDQVMETQLHGNRVVRILSTVEKKMVMKKERVIGSQSMYHCRLHLLNLWLTKLEKMSPYQREADGLLMLPDLPLVCLHKIFRCLAQPRDVIHLSQTCHKLQTIGSDPVLWERLFWYHFSDEQLQFVPVNQDGVLDWKEGFRHLRRVRLPCKEHPVLLELCCHCSCIYWEGQSHPCSSETPKEGETPGQEDPEVTTVTLSPSELIARTIKL